MQGGDFSKIISQTKINSNGNPVAASYNFHPILSQKFQRWRKGRGTQPLQNEKDISYQECACTQ